VVPAVVVEPSLSGSGEALPAGLADLFASAVVRITANSIAWALIEHWRCPVRSFR
jgi:hypothetical protein